MRLQGKVALITGGSLGIGRAIALCYAREGAKVAIVGRGRQALEEAVREIAAAGGEAVYEVADVQDAGQVERMIDRVVERWGRIDILVNNAGICNEAKFLDITEEEWDLHLNINLKGAFLVSRLVAQLMADRGAGGSIIHVSSVNGMKAEANQAHYNVSKAGMNMLAMSMALELAPYGIRVNALCPGFIETRLTKALIDDAPAFAEYVKSIPLGRVGQPEDLNGAALFLASDESLYMTGHCLVVDGGQVMKLV
jgi:NAD(P)-dependent dehydrogenase (short-subunit alcohol dehydrogenase family)